MKDSMNPQMHSAEHILNQTMVRMFQCGRCFSSHIEKRKSKCDYRMDRALKDEEIRRVEQEVNRAIRSDLPVIETLMTRAEAERRFNLDRLPAGAGDSIRIVLIGDYDACACIGPHVPSTGKIGNFKIISASFGEGVMRIRFKVSAREEE